MSYFRTFLILLIVAVSLPLYSQANEVSKTYERWIGSKCPAIRFMECDRTEHLPKTFKGKKTLLYSFDSGDFVNEPNWEKLFSQLNSLQSIRSMNPEDMLVIGFTYGANFSSCLSESLEIPQNIAEIAHLPVINLNSRIGDQMLEEPLKMLMRPGGILIDKNGVICKIYSHEMEEKDFKDAIMVPPWQEDKKKEQK